MVERSCSTTQDEFFEPIQESLNVDYNKEEVSSHNVQNIQASHTRSMHIFSHIQSMSANLNSSTRASSGVIVAHLMPTLCFLIALAESTVIWSFV